MTLYERVQTILEKLILSKSIARSRLSSFERRFWARSVLNVRFEPHSDHIHLVVIQGVQTP